MSFENIVPISAKPLKYRFLIQRIVMKTLELSREQSPWYVLRRATAAPRGQLLPQNLITFYQ